MAKKRKENRTEAAEVALPKRKPWTAEARVNLSGKLKQFYIDHPEKKQELSDKIKAGWTKEKRDEHALKMIEVLARPEVKEKMKKGMKAYQDKVKRALATVA